jgi:hypothetical protein
MISEEIIEVTYKLHQNFWKRKYMNRFQEKINEKYCSSQKKLQEEDWKKLYFQELEIKKAEKLNDDKTFTCFFDLPNEIIYLILSKVDDQSLLIFSSITDKINFRDSKINLFSICNPIWKDRLLNDSKFYYFLTKISKLRLIDHDHEIFKFQIIEKSKIREIRYNIDEKDLKHVYFFTRNEYMKHKSNVIYRKYKKNNEIIFQNNIPNYINYHKNLAINRATYIFNLLKNLEENMKYMDYLYFREIIFIMIKILNKSNFYYAAYFAESEEDKSILKIKYNSMLKITYFFINISEFDNKILSFDHEFCIDSLIKLDINESFLMSPERRNEITRYTQKKRKYLNYIYSTENLIDMKFNETMMKLINLDEIYKDHIFKNQKVEIYEDIGELSQKLLKLY